MGALERDQPESRLSKLEWTRLAFNRSVDGQTTRCYKRRYSLSGLDTCAYRAKEGCLYSLSCREEVFSETQRVWGHNRGANLARSLGFLGGQPNFHTLGAVFSSLLFRKIEVPQNVQHSRVLTHHECVEVPNSIF